MHHLSLIVGKEFTRVRVIMYKPIRCRSYDDGRYTLLFIVVSQYFIRLDNKCPGMKGGIRTHKDEDPSPPVRPDHSPQSSDTLRND